MTRVQLAPTYMAGELFADRPGESAQLTGLPAIAVTPAGLGSAAPETT